MIELATVCKLQTLLVPPNSKKTDLFCYHFLTWISSNYKKVATRADITAKIIVKLLTESSELLNRQARLLVATVSLNKLGDVLK